MGLTIPVRLSDGSGNVPMAATWNDDYDWLTSLALGMAFLQNGSMEAWAAGTTFTNPANATVLSDSWTELKSGTTPCTADVAREASVIDSGLYSMKVNITGAGSSDSYWAVKQSVVVPASFGSQTVLAGVRVKVATANKVRIKVYDGTNTAYSSYHTGDGTWQMLQAKLTCSATPSEVTTTIEVNPANFTDAAYLDSAYLYCVPANISARAQAGLSFVPLAGISAYLPLAGGTMTGNIAMGGKTITGTPGPTIQKFTSGSGTYTTPAGVKYIRVRMVGGGGGGSGASTIAANNGGSGGNGGNTTFGTTLLVANGGNGAIGGASTNAPAGGTASLGSGPIGIALQGGCGGCAASTGTGFSAGGMGGISPFGGAGATTFATTGAAGITNSGSGGGGGNASASATTYGGGGGGAGGYVDAIITSPAATYSYAVGIAGTAGPAGTGGTIGGAGGSGLIIVEEYYI